MIAPANVRLRLSSRPENVMLVREVLLGVADAVGMTPDVLNDIRTAVTEACNNVVLHAYEGGEGPLEVEVRCLREEIEVVVRDRGTGIRPQIGASREGASGVGLLVIQALAQRVAFQGELAGAGPRGEGGTEVCMTFAAPAIRTLQAPDGSSAGLTVDREPRAVGAGASIAIAPPALARAVLPRLLSALAARARFRTDRIADAQLVADVLAKHASDALHGTPLTVTVAVGVHELTLNVAPLGVEHPERPPIHSVLDGLGGVIERLTDDQQLAEVGSSGVLALRMVDSR